MFVKKEVQKYYGNTSKNCSFLEKYCPLFQNIAHFGSRVPKHIRQGKLQTWLFCNKIEDADCEQIHPSKTKTLLVRREVAQRELSGTDDLRRISELAETALGNELDAFRGSGRLTKMKQHKDLSFFARQVFLQVFVNKSNFLLHCVISHAMHLVLARKGELGEPRRYCGIDIRCSLDRFRP